MQNLRFDSREILWFKRNFMTTDSSSFFFFFIVTIKRLEKDMSLNNT